MAEYSYLVLNFSRGTSRDAARRILTDHAEYGHWELSRLRLYADGSRKATLRRKVIRAVRTQLSDPWAASHPGDGARPGPLPTTRPVRSERSRRVIPRPETPPGPPSGTA